MNNENHAQILHFDLQGKREDKYTFLNNNSLATIAWNKLEPDAPNFFFTKKDFDKSGNYEQGFKVDELFVLNNSGIATEFDELSIKKSKNEAITLLDDLRSKTTNVILSKYNLPIKKNDKVEHAITDIKKNKPIITVIDYRPFETKYTIYTGSANGIMGRPRHGIMKHMLKKNIALLTCRQQTTFNFQHIFITNKIADRCSVSLQTGEVGYVFPLYLYPDETSQDLFAKTERTPNLNKEIVAKIAESLGIAPPAPDGGAINGGFGALDILDYIYAVLHSPTYREKYKEFLKIDFPRVPYPKDVETFWQLVALGAELRQIHLLESPIVEKYITQYPIDGDNVVGKIHFENNRVYINYDKTSPLGIEGLQYFDNVPEVAWNFYIGGYQPAQKWLKDRKERTLEFEDILHYQKIIVALTETDRLMKAIDKLQID